MRSRALILAACVPAFPAGTRAGSLESVRASSALSLPPVAAALGEAQEPAPSAGSAAPISVLPVEIGGGLCSATLVGPRALLTAAHCGYLLGARSARVRYGSSTYPARVLRSPGYQGPGTHDVALLALDQELPGAVPVLIGAHAAVGTMVTLSGYGSGPGEASGGGPPRSGPSRVTRITPGGRIRIEQMDGRVARLGDSGGAVFIEHGGRRVLVGVISSGDGRSYTGAMSLAQEGTREFLRQASVQLGVVLCGLNLDC